MKTGSGDRKEYRALRLLITLAAVSAFALAFFLPDSATAQEQDLLGVFFDASGTIDRATTTTGYEPVPCYLILMNPGDPSGVSGWECIVELKTDGEAPLSSWTLEGDAINVDTAPRFSVGLGTVMPWSETVLLASGYVFVPAVGQEVEIYLHSYDPPSLLDPPSGGYPVYAPLYSAGDDPDHLIPLGWTAGCEGDPVAIVNDDLSAHPNTIDYSPSALNFGYVPVGGAATREVTFVNNTPLILSAAVSEDSDAYRIQLPGGLVTDHLQFQLRPNQQKIMVVELRPQAQEVHDVDIVIKQCDTVIKAISCTGNSLGPICSVSADTLDFGSIPVLQEAHQSFTITNIGGQNLTGTVSSPGSYFLLASGGGFFNLAPGEIHAVLVRYKPYLPGVHQGVITISGIDCANVICTGIAEAWPAVCDVEPSQIDFGNVALGQQVNRSFSITNNGGDTFSGHIPQTCGVFEVIAGAGDFNLGPTVDRVVTVRFAPQAIGDYECFLDLGSEICTPVQLNGTGWIPPSCQLDPAGLDFGFVMLGTEAERSFTLTNAGGGTLNGDVPLGCGDYEVLQGAGPFALTEGQSLEVIVRFVPTAIGVRYCELAVSDNCTDVGLLGEGVATTCNLDPGSLAFGDVALGSTAERALTVTNLGEDPLTGDVPAACGDFEVIEGAGPFSLLTDESFTIRVRFAPAALGDRSCMLEIEGLCADVPLSGQGVMPCELDPVSMDFGTVSLGSSAERVLTITNRGDDDLTGEVPAACGDFETILGAGAFSLSTGQSRTVRIRFAPTELGERTCILDLQNICDDVPLSGIGEPPTECVVNPSFIDFGLVPVGAVDCREITITNTGQTVIQGQVTEWCPAFYVAVGGINYTLSPGETHVAQICFAPTTLGPVSCEVQAGSDACGSVTCVGSGSSPITDPDVLGLFFDEGGLVNEGYSYGAPITMYLCLLNGTQASGVSGWECKVDWAGDLFILAWQPRGTAINVLEPPEFAIGLGTPLPWEQSIVLMEIDVLALASSVYPFYLLPVSVPSIPGSMAYAAGHDPGYLVPLNWPTGGPDYPVAFLNVDDPLALAAEPPRASHANGAVNLSWTYREDVADGCHVYRRLDGEPEQRLTDQPVVGVDGRAEYADPVSGYAAGTLIYYSYGLLKDGSEIARSPEVRMTLGGAVPGVTVLYPNYPNPFNPSTNIEFELRRAGHVRLDIFDLSGRKVRTLVDEQLVASRHHREWNGRDDSGRPVPSGAYYYRLEACGKVDMRKMVLLK